MGMALESGVGVVILIVGIRLVYGVAATLTGIARQLVMERARRRTLLTVARAVPEGGVVMDERPDGSKQSCAGRRMRMMRVRCFDLRCFKLSGTARRSISHST